MSEIHHVVPMIYNAAYNEDFFKECDANFQAMFKSSAFRYIFSQIQRTNHFLEVYKKLSEKNIKILVFKGIICRYMYNNPDDRISSDEDILIKKEDYEKVKEFFLSEGFEFIDKGEECAYFSKSNVFSYFCIICYTCLYIFRINSTFFYWFQCYIFNI